MPNPSPVPILAPDILTEHDAAQRLHVSSATLRNWRHQCRGPRYIKMGGIILYRLPDIIAYMDACVVDPLRRKKS